jgi:glycosyltransferase involved in cell wall biosynthesis
MNPLVSFIVPCYKLAHYLPECVNSILNQTFGDFELLIMDDCSPDNTPEVAASFKDPRVRYVRNEPNLGHLKNYNKGIGLTRGKYIWLISPDDTLRTPYVLERFVRVLEAHPRAGYVFCPVMDFDGDGERLGTHSYHGGKDIVFQGHDFIEKLLYSRCVPAASGMARKECYEKLSVFPLDLPFTGDEYLWSLFALHYDVAYLAEPMVNYRLHDASMTSSLRDKDVRILAWNWIEVPLRIKKKAEEAGYDSIVQKSRPAIVSHYAEHLFTTQYRGSEASITEDEFIDSLHRYASDPGEERWICGRVYAALGDMNYWQREFDRAQAFYRRGLEQDRFMLKYWIKYLLLRTGKLGIRFRELLLVLRHRGRHIGAI